MAGSRDPAIFLTDGTLRGRAASRRDHNGADTGRHACYNDTLVTTSVGVVSSGISGISGFGEGRQLKEQNSPFGVCG